MLFYVANAAHFLGPGIPTQSSFVLNPHSFFVGLLHCCIEQICLPIHGILQATEGLKFEVNYKESPGIV